MAGRHGRRALDPDAPVVDLDRVLADDARIDDIGRSPWPADAAAMRPARPLGADRVAGSHHRCARGEPLLDLFDEWRTELAARPLPQPLAYRTALFDEQRTERSAVASGRRTRSRATAVACASRGLSFWVAGSVPVGGRSA